MNKKQLIGLFTLILGIGLVIYGFYGVHRMKTARMQIERSTQYIPDNLIKDVVTGNLQSEVDQYRLPVTLLFIGGVILIIAGSVIIYVTRSRRR